MTISVKPTSVLYKRIKNLVPYILEGNVLAVDPSCGSTTSVPGWAHYRAGALINSGVIPVDPRDELHIRLSQIGEALRQRSAIVNATVLVYEDIPAVRFHSKGYTSGSQASLLKAVGVTMACTMCDHAIGLKPSVWKRLVRHTYKKSDERDAIEMGYIVIQIAREIRDASKSKKGRASAS